MEPTLHVYGLFFYCELICSSLAHSIMGGDGDKKSPFNVVCFYSIPSLVARPNALMLFRQHIQDSAMTTFFLVTPLAITSFANRHIVNPSGLTPSIIELMP